MSAGATIPASRPHPPAHARLGPYGQCPFVIEKFLYPERAVVHAVQDLVGARVVFSRPALPLAMELSP